MHQGYFSDNNKNQYRKNQHQNNDNNHADYHNYNRHNHHYSNNKNHKGYYGRQNSRYGSQKNPKNGQGFQNRHKNTKPKTTGYNDNYQRTNKRTQNIEADFSRPPPSLPTFTHPTWQASPSIIPVSHRQPTRYIPAVPAPVPHLQQTVSITPHEWQYVPSGGRISVNPVTEQFYLSVSNRSDMLSKNVY